MKETRGFRSKYVGLATALLLTGLTLACNDNGPTSPTFTPGPGMAGSPGPGMGIIADGTGTLASSVTAGMDRAIQDEYHAEFIYARVLADFGNVLPFANVVYAEQRHSESIARLYLNHDMVVPESVWNLDNVPRFTSITAACGTAVLEEEKNIAMYDEILGEELPYDVIRVMSANRQASLVSHLPAFRLCAGI